MNFAEYRPTGWLEPGQTLSIGSTRMEVLHTPGHTKDSVCLVFPQWVFTGDTLFLDDGGAGRDDLPGGDPGAHWESLRRLSELIDALADAIGARCCVDIAGSFNPDSWFGPHPDNLSERFFDATVENARAIIDAVRPSTWMMKTLSTPSSDGVSTSRRRGWRSSIGSPPGVWSMQSPGPRQQAGRRSGGSSYVRK